MDDLTLDEALEDLESAEDFLNYFGVAFDAAVVHVNRLHILQRFHDYIAKAGALPADEAVLRDLYTALLARAYQDFVASDALTDANSVSFGTAATTVSSDPFHSLLTLNAGFFAPVDSGVSVFGDFTVEDGMDSDVTAYPFAGGAKFYW